jgi:hypothetical protein
VNEPHQRFHDWLTAGADGEPPRDAALHASVCAACHQSIAALDLLAMVNTGLAPMPAEPTGREFGRLVMVGRLMGATAVLFSAAILGVGVSQLVGVSPGGGPVAQVSPTPEQSVLAQTATPQPTEAAPTPSPTAQETLTPLGTPVPTRATPGVTPIPWQPLPTPIPTAVPTAPPPTPIPTDTPLPSVSATPTPTVPGAPQSVGAIGGAGFVELTWQPPASDGGDPVVSYNVYRSTAPESPGVLVANNLSGTLWNDTNLDLGTYYYVVKAVNGIGEGPGSLEVPATVS